MGSNRKLIFGSALVVAGLVFWGLMTALNRANRIVAAPAPRPVAVPVALPSGGRMIAYAASDIPAGTLVTKNMIQMRALPGDAPTTSFVTDPQSQAVGFISGARISKGAQIRPSDDFVGHISEVGVAGMLRPGTRAIVIPFANKPTLHDLVAIGNLVDINAAFDGQESRTIVPAVRVLAVDVFGSDFPQINIARRGAYKADAKNDATSAAPGEVSAGPGVAPTPTPTPGQGGGRPDPAVTLEVTPEQANRILLAQASGAVLDFVVLPARGDAVLVEGTQPGTLIGDELGSVGGLTTISAVTKPQLAPYAERKKAAGGATRVAAASSGGGPARSEGSPRPPRASRRLNNDFSLPPLPTPLGGAASSGGNSVTQPPYPVPSNSAPPLESPTYNIPIYADGRTVRVETVPRPQD